MEYEGEARLLWEELSICRAALKRITTDSYGMRPDTVAELALKAADAIAGKRKQANHTKSISLAEAVEASIR